MYVHVCKETLYCWTILCFQRLVRYFKNSLKIPLLGSRHNNRILFKTVQQICKKVWQSSWNSSKSLFQWYTLYSLVFVMRLQDRYQQSWFGMRRLLLEYRSFKGHSCANWSYSPQQSKWIVTSIYLGIVKFFLILLSEINFYLCWYRGGTNLLSFLLPLSLSPRTSLFCPKRLKLTVNSEENVVNAQLRNLTDSKNYKLLKP